jgi:hypothetical protein
MNTLTQYFVPEWVSIAFLVTIPIPFILLLLLVNKEGKKINNAFVLPVVSVFFILYLTYITIAGYKGWFDVVSFPPKVLLLTTFPYAFLLFGVLINTKAYQKILESVAVEDLIKLHIFRLIGVFFVLLAFYDALPKPFAFIAGFGDMITAISSIFVVKAIQNKKHYAKKMAFYWNIFGTIDILFTAIAANVLTKISNDTGVMGVDTLAFFPFCIIPAFAPPTILFLHWAIHKKLRSI